MRSARLQRKIVAAEIVPAAQVSAATTVADYEDWAALDKFAEAVDVITLEFENIPVATLEYLAQRKPVVWAET